jgi:3-methyladenine DNA glycosylase AlkD
VTTKTPAELVAAYIKLRDKKEAANAEFKKSMEPTNQIMGMLEATLLQKLEELGVDSLSAKGIGTVYRNRQDSATVQDKPAFRAWVQESGNWDAVDLRANKVAVRHMLDEGQEIPGVSFTTINTVGIRRS